MALLPDNKNSQPAQATQSASPQPKRKGTGFTNLQRILQASQGSKLGQTIAGGITSQAQQVQSGIRSAQEQFRTEAKKETDKLDAGNRRVIIDQAVSDPSNLRQDAQSIFQGYLSGEYKGPMELANRQQLAAQAQQAETVGRLASGIGSRSGTEAGDRQQLLSRFAGGADYTSGQRKLDESILARDKDANLAAAARQTRGVAEQAQRAGAVAQQEAQQYQNLAKIFAKETRDQITEARDPISTQLDKTVSEAEEIEKARTGFLKKVQDYTNTNEYIDMNESEKLNKLKSFLSELGPSIGEQKNLGLLSKEEIDEITGQKGFLSTLNEDVLRNKQLYNTYKQIYDSTALYGLKNSRFANELAGQLGSYINPDNKKIIDTLIQTLTPGVSGSDILAKNINRQGLADEMTMAKLNALSSLVGEDVEFSKNPEKYKQGDISLFGTTGTRRNLIENKLNQATDNLNNLNQLLKRVADASPYSSDPSRLKSARIILDQINKFKKYKSEYENELSNIKKIEDKEILK